MPVSSDKAKLLKEVVVKGGRGTDEDAAIVRRHLEGLPVEILALLKKKGVKVVACHDSVTDFDSSLRNKVPRGWEKIGRKWDTVPGAFLKKRNAVAIATVAAGSGPRVVPERGPKTHGSFALALHETMHGHDIAAGSKLSKSKAFRAARDADRGKLDPYYLQGGKAGLQESYAESAARHFGGDPTVASQWPGLSSWWRSNPTAAINADGADADAADDADDEYAADDAVGSRPIGTATFGEGGAIHLDLSADDPDVGIAHAAFTYEPGDPGYGLVYDHVMSHADAAGDSGGPASGPIVLRPFDDEGAPEAGPVAESSYHGGPSVPAAPDEALDSLFWRGGECGGGDDDWLEYDEDGSLALARALNDADSAADSAEDSRPKKTKACPVGDLNGSWYLQLTPQGPHTLAEIRGPMRIEVRPPKLRISGDIYVRKPAAGTGSIEMLRPITERPLFFGKRWYPHLPIGEYSWYFRSLGVSYKKGKLVFKFERRLWNRTRSEFVGQGNNSQDVGFMRLDCVSGRMISHELLPQPTLQLTGTATIGGETYRAVATKTSPFYRGCAVEVDVMTGRSFPLSATTVNGSAISFESIYRTAGWDCAVTVDQNNLRDDAELSNIELQTALTSNRKPKTNPDAWRLWLLIGSGQGGLFGLMFDDIEPFREGTAGFYDPRFGNDPLIAPHARNKKLGEVPEAFLRTLVHEAGHAFNLFHPKHDVHSVPVGTTIMNQTGDVMGFATPSNPYPGNITFAFDSHNRTSLIHSPDPQVAPGWKRFGWGHGSLSSGIAEPVDALGFLRDTAEADGLTLELILPDTIFRGEFVAAQFVVANHTSAPRRVTAAVNLSQGDLRLLVTPPSEEISDVRDVILGCGDRPMTVLEPGETITGSGQVFYTNVGFTFRHTGRYIVSAELDVGDDSGAVLRSAPAVVVVRSPRDEAEEAVARLTLNVGVGRAFAFGDYGTDEEARDKLKILAEEHGGTETGIAASLVLANAAASGLRDLYSDEHNRPVDQKGAEAHFDRAARAAKAAETAEGDGDREIVRIATAVCAPTAGGAPLLAMTERHLRTPAGGGDKGSDGESGCAALDILKSVRQTLGGLR